MAKQKYNPGDKVYIVENATWVREAIVVRASGGFCVLRLSGGGGIRLRETRLFGSRSEADEAVRRLREANAEITAESLGRTRGKGDDRNNTGDIGWLG